MVKVRDLGRSPDGQAAQLQVLSNVSQGYCSGCGHALAGQGPAQSRSPLTACRRACPCTWPARSPSTWTSRPSRDNMDSHIELSSIIFIIGLLLLVFLAAARAARHPHPGRSSPPPCQARRRPSPAALAEGIAAGPVTADRAGPRRGHRLRPVPGPPGVRNPRAGQDTQEGGDRWRRNGLGESTTLAAATAHRGAAVPGTCHLQVTHSALGIPLAIGIGVVRWPSAAGSPR